MTRTILAGVLAGAAVFCPTFPAAEPRPPAGLDAKVGEHVRERMRQGKVPGLSLAVVRDGKVVMAAGYGLANLEHAAPATAETVYQAASIGKQLTAAAVMLLVEEGKLKLDTLLSEVLPESLPAGKGVTIRQLLSHTSGIKDYTKKDFNHREDHTESQLLAKFARFPPDFAPGAEYRYSNTGYALLGMVIRRITDEYHGDFVRRRILTPLGMTATRVISEADIVPRRASGYRLIKRRVRNQEWVAPSLNTLADGCLYTTVLDLAKWDLAVGAGRVLRKETLERVWTPAVTADGKTGVYGLGWKIGEVNGRRLVEHRGSWQGFRGHLVRYRDDGLTVIVLSNLATAAAERVAREVAGMYRAELVPPVPTPLKETDPESERLVRRVLELLAAGKPDPRLFTEEGRKGFFPDDAEDWQEILENVGPVASLTLVGREVEKGLPRYRYLADLGEIGLRIGVTMSKGKITDLSLHQY